MARSAAETSNPVREHTIYAFGTTNLAAAGEIPDQPSIDQVIENTRRPNGPSQKSAHGLGRVRLSRTPIGT
jgi:hypothetical protein